MASDKIICIGMEERHAKALGFVEVIDEKEKHRLIKETPTDKIFIAPQLKRFFDPKNPIAVQGKQKLFKQP